MAGRLENTHARCEPRRTERSTLSSGSAKDSTRRRRTQAGFQCCQDIQVPHPRQQMPSISSPPRLPKPQLPSTVRDSGQKQINNRPHARGGGLGRLRSSLFAVLYLIFTGSSVGSNVAMLPPSPLPQQGLSGRSITDDDTRSPTQRSQPDGLKTAGGRFPPAAKQAGNAI